MAQAFEEVEHAAGKEAHDGESDDDEADPGDGADGFVVELACVFGRVIDFVRAEEVLREKEVEDGGDEEGTGEDEGAVEEKFAIGDLLGIFFDFGGDALDVENLVVVEEGVEEGRLGPVRDEDGDA